MGFRGLKIKTLTINLLRSFCKLMVKNRYLNHIKILNNGNCITILYLCQEIVTILGLTIKRALRANGQEANRD